MTEPNRYYGKYRGTVVNNVDPMQKGRCQVLVPDVSNVMLSSWAMPSLPMGGMQMGMFTVPPIGAGVWVEFEQGDADYPIITGGFWGTVAEIPTMAQMIPPSVPGITLQTPLQNGINVSDVPGPTGGILLMTASGATISISDAGITISNGRGAVISMIGNTVDINGGALTII
jgi:uncharacterized protein involved in type VI secretion and phage assembly